MDKKEVLAELRKVQDFDSDRNHVECLLLNLIDDAEIAEAFMDAEERTQTGYRTRTVRCGDTEPEVMQAMQMIDQIMQDLPDHLKDWGVIQAWFEVMYDNKPYTTCTFTGTGANIDLTAEHGDD